MGCPRSGTTFLYHALLSAGNFAVYRAESQVFNVLEPLFGNLKFEHQRYALLTAWYESPLFSKSGLPKGEIDQEVILDCRNGGDFLRVVMEAIARMQGVERWAECTPEHLLYLGRIKRTIPEALIIHVLRDGRDVCLSLAKQRWIKPFPWDHSQDKCVAALYWEWIVNHGRAEGGALGDSYVEVRYEDLVLKPRETLASLSSFVGQPLDYDQILKNAIGSVSQPNTSFDGEFKPVSRWERLMTNSEKQTVQALIGKTLTRLGYTTPEKMTNLQGTVSLALRSIAYHTYFDTKFLLKFRTPLGELMTSRDLSWT